MTVRAGDNAPSSSTLPTSVKANETSGIECSSTKSKDIEEYIHCVTYKFQVLVQKAPLSQQPDLSTKHSQPSTATKLPSTASSATAQNGEEKEMKR